MPGDDLSAAQLDRLDLYRDPAVRAGLAYEEVLRGASARDIEIALRILKLWAELDPEVLDQD